MRPATIVRDAAITVALAAALAVASNLVRDSPLPWVAREPYALFVPCPEPLGEVTAVTPQDAPLGDGSLVIDARPPEEYAAGHVAGARSVVFDYLDPVPDAAVRDVAASGAARVVVYGDGASPDSGHELARELSGRGVRNVLYVEGGAPALRAAGRLAPGTPGEVTP